MSTQYIFDVEKVLQRAIAAGHLELARLLPSNGDQRDYESDAHFLTDTVPHNCTESPRDEDLNVMLYHAGAEVDVDMQGPEVEHKERCMFNVHNRARACLEAVFQLKKVEFTTHCGFYRAQ